MSRIDLTGQRFGRLTVLGEVSCKKKTARRAGKATINDALNDAE